MTFTSLDWKVIAATRASVPKPMKTATIESDNHADTWCDDAWDKHRSIGIHCEEPELLIPFRMDGSTALFVTRTPTEDEIRDLFDERIE